MKMIYAKFEKTLYIQVCSFAFAYWKKNSRHTYGIAIVDVILIEHWQK